MKIEDYELPLSSHASKGTAIYCIVFVISLCAMEVESASPYVLYGAMLLLALNHFYWYFKDHQTYSTYKSNYISTLDQLDVVHIERKLKSVDFGSPTERFLTSYLRKARGWVSPACYDSKPEYKCL